MERFFTAYPGLDVSFQEIIPNAGTEEGIRSRAVYADFINAISPQAPDEMLDEFRVLAQVGALDKQHFDQLNQRFMQYRSQLLMGEDKLEAYGAINQCALLIAQVLFVDNCIREGLGDLLEPASLKALQSALGSYIQENSWDTPSQDAVSFYSLLYILQTAFDKIFVPDEEVVNYEPETGLFKIHQSYDQLTAYLTLSNKKVITASDQEKTLCYNLTTGWGQGIDRETWDQLNRQYYDGDDDHFFSKYYSTTLEKMLPQFTYGRMRLAESLLRDWQDESELQVLEIGAGSGSFTLDLHMAARRLQIKTRINYLGVEPSLLKDQFLANAERKTGGVVIPEGWRITGGALEDVAGDPDRYIDKNLKTVIVLSYCAHHCFHQSLDNFLRDPGLRDKVEAIYILDGTNEHGWTKMYYMWIDVQSPENFDNLHAVGIWNSQLVWQEPDKPISGYAVTNAWCQLRRLT